jgi:hypothetical protein
MVLVSVLLLSLMHITVLFGVGGIVINVENIDTVLRNLGKVGAISEESTGSFS